MKISKRLVSLAALVDEKDILADIGCDHALLDIYLVKNKIVSKTLACDINESALNSGIFNIKKHHLEPYIETKLGNGIEVINDDINTLIISGMGTSTICKILSCPKVKQIKKIIVESNNNYYDLRKFICGLGFYISYEEVVLDAGKFYVNIIFLKGMQKYSKKEFRYGPVLMKNKNNSDYYEFLYQKNLSILNKIPKNKFLIRYQIIKENRFIKKLIKKPNSINKVKI